MKNNVQLENGYTRIANELLEAIYSTNFNATQLKILFCIIRYTYGFNRKEHSLSITFISKATGISRRFVSSELNKLIERKVIIVKGDFTVTQSRVISINKYYNNWEGYRTTLPLVKNTSTDEEYSNTTVEQPFNTTVEQSFYQERQYKEKTKEKEYLTFFEILWAAYPNKKGKSAVTDKTKKQIFKEVSKSQMLNAIEKYKNETKDIEKRFIMHGSTWFNGRYVDYIEEVKEDSAPPRPQEVPVYKDYNEKIAELEEAELRRMRNGHD
ncbi:MAG: replication protein [Gudongella sp.]|nr:replication protein [Gudongella sp.]